MYLCLGALHHLRGKSLSALRPLVIDKVQITRLKDRPVMMGTFGAVFALASVLGPLLGKQNLQEVSELSSPSRQAARSLITSAGDGVSTLICLCVMMKETRV